MMANGGYALVKTGADEMTEGLLAIGAVAAVAAAVLAVRTLASAALRLAAAYFFAPVQPPPSLGRLAALVERQVAERQAAAAAIRGREPPPAEIVLALRAVTRGDRRPK